MEQSGESQGRRIAPLRLAWRWLPLIVMLCFIQLKIEPHPNRGFRDRDATQHFLYALNLAESGTFSLARERHRLIPDAIRTPAYSAVMAIALKFIGVPAHESAECFLKKEGKCRAVHVPIQRMNLLLYMAMIIVTYTIALRVCGSVLLAFLSACLAALGLIFNSIDYRTEVMAATLLLIHVEGLRRIAQDEGPRPYVAIVSGLAGGVLVLTTASFLAWLYLMILSVPALHLLGRAGLRVPPVRSVGIVAVLMCLVAGSWMTRNLVQTGRFTISERGGSVMAVRAEYDSMSWDEYRAAWKLFPDHSYMQYLVDRNDVANGGRFGRRQPTGFYRRSRHLFLPLYFPVLAERSAEELAESRRLNHHHSAVAAHLQAGVVLDDGTLQRAALAAMWENWVMHIALIPPLALRGAGAQAPFLLAILCMIAWRRSLPMAVFIAPVLVSIGFHAALTHYIPRYGFPLIPVTAIAMAWGLSEIAGMVWHRLQPSAVPAKDTAP